MHQKNSQLVEQRKTVKVADYSDKHSAVGRSFLVAQHFDQRSEGGFALPFAANKESTGCSRYRTFRRVERA